MREVTAEPKPESAKTGEKLLSIGSKVGRRGGVGHLSIMTPTPCPEEHHNLSSRGTSVQRNHDQMARGGRSTAFTQIKAVEARLNTVSLHVASKLKAARQSERPR